MSRNSYSRHYWLIAFLLFIGVSMMLFWIQPSLRGVQANNTTDYLGQLREQLLTDPTSVSGNWLRTLNPLVKNVQGDVVWNSTQQQGVLRIRALPSPKTGTFYQLWLYDARGHTNDGISGGIINQGAKQDVLLAMIKTDSVVQEPYKFELTLQTGIGTENGQILLMMQP